MFFFFYDYQESPTGELVDYSFSIMTDSNEQECESDGKTPELDPEPDIDAQFCEAQGKNQGNGQDVKIWTS